MNDQFLCHASRLVGSAQAGMAITLGIEHQHVMSGLLCLLSGMMFASALLSHDRMAAERRRNGGR